jgi:serine/threonine-protein kinase
MPLPLLLRILSDVCAGLHAAHELRGSDGVQLGVVHRDVSPPNVLIATNGAVKVIDFGVAKARDRLVEETGAGLAKGKARYMAPEQAMGRAIDRRADVYSVGAIAYEMFEHVGPYDGANDMARIHALITGGAITKMASSPPPAVQAFILRALSRDPGSRFQTCADLRDAIEAAMTAARLRATSEDVAKFLAEKTGSRIEERHSLVKMALDAAGERERFRKLLDGVPAYHPREQSSSGIKNAPAFSPEESNLETLSASALSVIPNSISTAAALPVHDASDSAVEPEGDAAPEVDELASERPPASDFSRESGAPPPARRRAGLYAIGGFAALALVIGAAAFAQRTRHAAAPAQAPALTSAPVPLSVGTATVATSLTPPSLPALAPPVASVQPSAAVAVDASAPRRPTVAAGASSATSLRATSTAKPPASAVRPPIRPKHDDNEIQ